KITKVAAGTHDHLDVSMTLADPNNPDQAPELLRSIDLDQVTSTFNTWVLSVPADLIGKSATLTFELTNPAGNPIQSTLLLDNILFGEQVQTVDPLIVGQGSHFAIPTIQGPAAGLPDKKVEIKISGPLADFLQADPGSLPLMDQTLDLKPGQTANL